MAEISETKTPKAGEWWVRNSGGRIFFIVGLDPWGCVVHWNEDVGFFTSKMRFFCREFHHEPRCTGFGWVEPPAETLPRYFIYTGTDVCHWKFVKITEYGTNPMKYEDGIMQPYSHIVCRKDVEDFTKRCLWKEITEAEALARVTPPTQTVRTIDVNPGDGYRWLEDDEIVTPTDEVFRPDLSPCWVKPLTRVGYSVAYRGDDDYPIRRSIARTQPVEPPEEVWPKYYILDETKGVCKAPWYIERTSDKEGLRWGLNCDGVTVGFESQSWGGQSDVWLEVTESEALARVAIDPGDGYELLPVGTMLERYDQVLGSTMTGPSWMDTVYFGECVGSRRGLEGPYRRYRRKIKPVEPPVDWVTQDIVPMRADDEFSWSIWEPGEWSISTEHVVAKYEGLARHGWIYPDDGSIMSVRCRRKDLPVAVPATKRVPVRLWINEEDGWLFANTDQVLASDEEILHDADGFFVESPAEDPNDMPLNPVLGKVIATGTVTLTPVESPDDWVEYDALQITCPRISVDWLTPKAGGPCLWEHASNNWSDVKWTEHRGKWNIRCLRKDLPIKPDNMAAIIAEHTQQVRELTQRIGDLVQQVNQRDAVIEEIRTALRQEYSV